MAIVSGDAPAKFHFRYYPATRDQRSGASPFKASPVGLETLVGKPGHPVTETGARFMGMDFGSGSTSEKWMAVREGKGPHGYEVVLEHSGRSSARGELEFTNPLPLGKYRLKFKVYAEALDREGKGFEPVDTCIAGLYVNEVRVADFSIPVGSEPVEYVQEIQTGIERTKIKISAGTQVGRIEAGRVPRLVLTEAEIEGPLMDSWPLPSHQTVLGDDPKAKPEVWLQPFLTRAFRRPASSQEVSRYAEIYYAERKEDATHEEAARVALEAVLVSPSFLYLVEQPRPTGGLNDFEFASRLSYFLWSSMPDETLMELAEKGRLRDPNVLRPQVARMLEDPKAEALTQEFAGQWLSLRRIGDLVPDTTIFPGFDDSLRDSMRGEGEAFFREVLINNLPVRTFLSSDFTFANQRLARHYGFPPMQGAALQKVSIPKDNPRGGLVTQAGILAVYSQQTRSSPIKRGVFILEKLFNRPPPNPPADVPPLEEEVSKVELGAESLREMMERHASDPSCAGCHAKIDPWGLALEEFNGIGAFRTVGKETITSRLHDGRVISGVAGLREELLRRETDFVRGLTEKLMVYGLGRTLKKSDRDDIEAIMTKAKTADYKMKALLISVIESASFQQY